MALLVVGEYIKNGCTTAYEVLNTLTDTTKKVSEAELKENADRGTEVQNIWHDEIYRYTCNMKCTHEIYVRPLGWLLSLMNNSVLESRLVQLLEDYFKSNYDKYNSFAIVGKDSDKYVIYNYVSCKAYRIDAILALELINNDEANLECPSDMQIKVSNSAKPNELITDTYIDDNGLTHIDCKNNFSEVLVINRNDGEYISEIKANSIKKLIVPSGVKSIKFSDMNEKVVWSNLVRGHKLVDSKSLTEVKIANGLEIISNRCFYRCVALRHVELPKSLMYIGQSAFFACSSLESIHIPDNVEYIESSTFCGCTALREVVLPKSLKYIGNRAFFDCREISSIELPDGLEVIESQAFSACGGITEIIIPESVRLIGYSAFDECIHLRKVTIKSNDIEIVDSAFEDCTSLQLVRVPKGLNIDRERLMIQKQAVIEEY